MTSTSLAEDYLRWLEPQIRDQSEVRDDRTYWDLIKMLAEKEFFVPEEFARIAPFDENRIEDGKELRIEFCYAKHVRPNALQHLGPCSFLEVLIGLSRRLSFEAGGNAPGWAWQLMSNLELLKMADPLSRRKATRVNDILDTVIHRRYAPDGTGGFFPLAWPDEDQTTVQLWYQMAAYISELHPEH